LKNFNFLIQFITINLTRIKEIWYKIIMQQKTKKQDINLTKTLQKKLKQKTFKEQLKKLKDLKITGYF